MEPGDCPPLNINAMRAISVKSYLKIAKSKMPGPMAAPNRSGPFLQR